MHQTGGQVISLANLHLQIAVIQQTPERKCTARKIISIYSWDMARYGDRKSLDVEIAAGVRFDNIIIFWNKTEI